MSFADHLEELRRRVLLSFIAVGVFVGIAFCFTNQIVQVFVLPWVQAREAIKAETGRDIGALKFIAAPEAFLFHFKVAMIAGLLAGGPFALYQLWLFVSAGLYVNERKAVLRSFPVSLLLFAGGLAFAYFVLVPTALKYLVDFPNPELFEPMISVENYFSFFGALHLIMGLVFQLPLLIIILDRFGIVSARTMGRHRKIAVFVAIVAAAILTPTGDAITLTLVTIPMVGLYEAGLFVANRSARKRGVKQEGG